MNTAFADLTALHQEWQSLQPLQPEHKARLWKKLRLEWNYHSNHIEGNTLTYGETELLLIHDRTHGDHTHREYLEMKAHDLGIGHVRSLAADSSRFLTEGDIRDLNQIILKEPFWKAAQTADGQPSRKEVVPGQYKTSPNHVRTVTGEVFNYATVEETPPRMATLVSWLRRQLEEPALPPVAIAAKLHHDFVLIHPFDDGNGRVARLLVNYVLMRFGYLPVIVPTKEKTAYINALGLADAGDLAPLVGYLAGLTAKSLTLGIKAAKGESIEERSDVEKELELFIRQQQGSEGRVIRRSREAIQALSRESLQPLVSAVEVKLKKLDPLFTTHDVIFYPSVARDDHGIESLFRIDVTDVLSAIVESIVPGDQFGHVLQLQVQHQFRGYRGHAPDPFTISVSLLIQFDEFQYSVHVEGIEALKKLYSEPILADEVEAVATKMLSNAFDQVKQRYPTTAP